MEVLVAVLIVVALVAIAVRFGLGGPTGSARLPRIVDDSIGMWVLRRVTGRPLMGRPAGDRPDPFARFRRPSTALATRVPPPRPPGTRRPDQSAPVAARARTSPSATVPTLPAESGPEAPAPDTWQVIPRPPAGRAFGSPIVPAADPARARRRGGATVVVGYLGLAVVVAVVAFIAGAALGVVSSPGGSPGATGSSTGRTGSLGSPSTTTRLSAGPEPLSTVREP